MVTFLLEETKDTAQRGMPHDLTHNTGGGQQDVLVEGWAVGSVWQPERSLELDEYGRQGPRTEGMVLAY